MAALCSFSHYFHMDLETALGLCSSSCNPAAKWAGETLRSGWMLLRHHGGAEKPQKHTMRRTPNCDGRGVGAKEGMFLIGYSLKYSWDGSLEILIATTWLGAVCNIHQNKHPARGTSHLPLLKTDKPAHKNTTRQPVLVDPFSWPFCKRKHSKYKQGPTYYKITFNQCYCTGDRNSRGKDPTKFSQAQVYTAECHRILVLFKTYPKKSKCLNYSTSQQKQDKNMWKSMETHWELTGLLPNTVCSLRNGWSVYFLFSDVLEKSSGAARENLLVFIKQINESKHLCSPQCSNMRRILHLQYLDDFFYVRCHLHLSAGRPPVGLTGNTKMVRHLCPVLSKQPSLLPHVHRRALS